MVISTFCIKLIQYRERGFIQGYPYRAAPGIARSLTVPGLFNHLSRFTTDSWISYTFVWGSHNNEIQCWVLDIKLYLAFVWG
jgi:hypothetical protein